VGSHTLSVGFEGEYKSDGYDERGTALSVFASKYQFKHLSFQEAFFAEALTTHAAAAGTSEAGAGSGIRPELSTAAQAIWAKGALQALNTRWLLNTFRICGPSVASSVVSHLGGLTTLRLADQQVHPKPIPIPNPNPNPDPEGV
jgi:hypothetical protein